MLCMIAIYAGLLCKEVKLNQDRSLLDRGMRAATRIVPSIDVMRVMRGLNPYAVACLYTIYATPLDKIKNLPCATAAHKIKTIIGGVRERVKLEKKQSELCDTGISALLKPLSKIISIETEGALFKISLLGFFKDQMIQDAKDLKKWCSVQGHIIKEELTGSFIIPEKTPLTVKERAIYLYHLLSNAICRCTDPINVDVLKEMTEGCTAEDLENIVYRCAHIDKKVLTQVSTYYAGMTLAQSLLEGENFVRTCIYPITNDQKTFGKVQVREAHILEKTTTRSLKEKCMIALAGKIAAEMCEIELSSLFTQEIDATVKAHLRQCMYSEQRLEEEQQKLESEMRLMLESYHSKLDKIIKVLQDNWEITADHIEEILTA